jgi:hypothetical protein
VLLDSGCWIVQCVEPVVVCVVSLVGYCLECHKMLDNELLGCWLVVVVLRNVWFKLLFVW